jgi:hypothetical protein
MWPGVDSVLITQVLTQVPDGWMDCNDANRKSQSNLSVFGPTILVINYYYRKGVIIHLSLS